MLLDKDVDDVGPWLAVLSKRATIHNVTQAVWITLPSGDLLNLDQVVKIERRTWKSRTHRHGLVAIVSGSNEPVTLARYRSAADADTLREMISGVLVNCSPSTRSS